MLVVVSPLAGVLAAGIGMAPALVIAVAVLAMSMLMLLLSPLRRARIAM